jgi:hypothetical protein
MLASAHFGARYISISESLAQSDKSGLRPARGSYSQLISCVSVKTVTVKRSLREGPSDSCSMNPSFGAQIAYMYASIKTACRTQATRACYKRKRTQVF